MRIKIPDFKKAMMMSGSEHKDLCHSASIIMKAWSVVSENGDDVGSGHQRPTQIWLCRDSNRSQAPVTKACT